jgi:hypothetical protein
MRGERVLRISAFKVFTLHVTYTFFRQKKTKNINNPPAPPTKDSPTSFLVSLRSVCPDPDVCRAFEAALCQLDLNLTYCFALTRYHFALATTADAPAASTRFFEEALAFPKITGGHATAEASKFYTDLLGLKPNGDNSNKDVIDGAIRGFEVDIPARSATIPSNCKSFAAQTVKTAMYEHYTRVQVITKFLKSDLYCWIHDNQIDIPCKFFFQ